MAHKFDTPLMGDNGMNLLDYFASMALIAIMIRQPDIEPTPAAFDAYEMAEAMMLERQETQYRGNQ